MFVLIHSKCGRSAWLMTVKPAPGSLIDLSQFRELDGRPFDIVEGMRCRTCGLPVLGPKSENVVSLLRAAALEGRTACAR